MFLQSNANIPQLTMVSPGNLLTRYFYRQFFFVAGLDIVKLGFVRVVTRGLYHFRRRAYHIQHRCQPPSRAY